MSGPMIVVWRFHDAPKDFQALSPHGGDEDWLALVPPELSEAYIGWLEYGSFGVCEITRHVLPCGSSVYIGAHA